MKNRIDQLFREKGEEILSIYMTAGYPALEDTSGILEALQEAWSRYGGDWNSFFRSSGRRTRNPAKQPAGPIAMG